MKKIILSILTGTMLLLTASAQQKKITTIVPEVKPTVSKLKILIGLDEGIPVGTLSDHSSVVMGVSVQGEYLILKNLGVTLSANYLYFLANDGGSGLSMAPVFGGLNYYITPKLFLSGELGTSFYTGSEEGDKTVKRGYLSYAQGIGYKISKRINVTAKYQGVNLRAEKNYSFVGLRFAYVLPVNRQ